MRIRLRDLAKVLVALATEGALLLGLWKASPVLGSIDFSHVEAWVRNTDPTTAVLAVLRLAGMIFAAWMLVTTAVYLTATITGAEEVARRSGWVTLPVVRRMIDGLAAASILASTFSTSGGSASATPVTAVVQPYVPVAASAPVQLLHAVSPAPTGALVAATSTNLPARVGRHLPHPDVIQHAVLAAHATPAPTLVPTAPSPANGYAGLPPGTKVVVVQPGQCLSVIAQEHLSGNWQTGDSEIHALNVGRVQPDGRALTDDHWIYPGWVLIMPATAVDTLVVPGSPLTQNPVAALPLSPVTVLPASPTDPGVTIHPGASPADPAAHTPTSSRPFDANQGIANRAPAAGAYDPTRVHPAQEGKQAPSRIVSLPVELVGAGVLAAGLITLLTKLTVVANGRRRRGRRTSAPTAEGARLELAARIGADFDTMEIIDLGCKFLAVQLSGSPPPPPVLAVETTTDWLAFLLGETVRKAPDGFTVGPEGQSWILQQPQRLLQVADQLADVVAPFPSLVTLGRTDDDVIVLANLGGLGSVSIEGDPRMAAEVLTAAAVELATVPWTQQAEVILVGFGHTEGLGVAEPVTVVNTLEECLSRLHANSLGLQASADETDATSLDEMRLAGNPIDLDPAIVICLEQPAPPWLDQLTQLTSSPRSGLSAVMVAGPATTGGWTLRIDDQGRLSIPPLDKAVTAQRIPLPLFDEIEDRIESAADTSDYPADLSRPDWWPDAADRLPAADVLPMVDADLDDDLADDLADDDIADSTPAPEEPPHAAPLTGDPVHRLRALRHDYPYLPPQVFNPPPDILVQVLTSEPRILRRRHDHYEWIPISRARALEAIVYLACHAPGVTSTRLAAALQPELALGQAPADRTSTFGTVMSTARKALGATSDGSLYLPHKAHERYKMADAVMLDWDAMKALQAAAHSDPDTHAKAELLASALDLLTDEPPFAEIHRLSRRQRATQRDGHWHWFEIEFLTDIEHTITDIAGELAELHEQAGDHRAASKAARKGLQISPLDRTLRSIHLSSEAALGPSHLQCAWQEAVRIFESHGEPFDQVDEDLRRHYLLLLDKTG